MTLYSLMPFLLFGFTLFIAIVIILDIRKVDKRLQNMEHTAREKGWKGIGKHWKIGDDDDLSPSAEARLDSLEQGMQKPADAQGVTTIEKVVGTNRRHGRYLHAHNEDIKQLKNDTEIQDGIIKELAGRIETLERKEVKADV